jgi:hypothetical protein
MKPLIFWGRKWSIFFRGPFGLSSLMAIRDQAPLSNIVSVLDFILESFGLSIEEEGHVDWTE